METKIINLFGNPGSGKSTIAAYLFAELKRRGYETELVPEVAKDLIWEEDWKALHNQVYVFAMQLQHIDRLISKVEYIITDSPLLMQIGYYKERDKPAPKHFKKLCMAYNNQYNNINIYLKNNKNISQIGRAEISLNPMKYLQNIQFDIKANCTQGDIILQHILTFGNDIINKEDTNG